MLDTLSHTNAASGVTVWFFECSTKPLLAVYAGLLDHCAPARDFRAHESREFGGRTADRLHARREELLADRRRSEQLHDLRVQTPDDGIGGARRREDRVQRF